MRDMYHKRSVLATHLSAKDLQTHVSDAHEGPSTSDNKQILWNTELRILGLNIYELRRTGRTTSLLQLHTVEYLLFIVFPVSFIDKRLLLTSQIDSLITITNFPLTTLIYRANVIC